MQRFFDFLRPLMRVVVRRAGVTLAIAALLTAGSLMLAKNLTIDTDLAQLLPPDYPSVQALEELRETVGGESNAAVGITSPSFEANKKFAETLISEALELTGEGREEPYFSRVEYRRDTEFLENNALYFASSAELSQLETYLNDQIRQAKLQANPFFADFGDEFADEEAEPDTTAEELSEAYQRIVGQEYPISPDSTTLVLRLYPTGAQTNIGYIDDAYADLQALVDSLRPASFHSEMEVTLAGRLLRQSVEIKAITNDVFSSFGAGVTAVLIAIMLYFFYKAYRARAGARWRADVFFGELIKSPLLSLIIALPLFMSLTWTGAVAYLAFGTLNLMTATLGLVLFGLGIDFGIHFYARYTEERGEGLSVEEAADVTFASTGQAIATGALTTASALFVLVIADFRGFSEFGMIAGVGILFALISMIVVLPALLAFMERLRLLNLTALHDEETIRATRGRFPFARPVVGVSLAVVVAAVVALPQLEFEYRFGELEPTYEEYEAKDDVIDRVSSPGGGGRNPAYILADTPEEVDEIVRALRLRAEQDTLSPTILRVESLQDRFPLRDSTKQAKLERIAEIRGLLDNKFLSQDSSAELQQLRTAAQTREPLEIADVPEYLRKQFTSKSGEVGNFVMVYPSVGLSDGRLSMAFAEDVGTVTTEDGSTYRAGSTSLVAADMLRLMLKEAPWMIMAAFVIVALLMYLNFGSVRWAALALLPLVVGILWMIGTMELFGLRLNFYNLVVLPAILGIGNDAGVHLVHRYWHEGRGSMLGVLRSTGEHVFMASLTTGIGFAGLLLSFHPGLHTIGQLAVIGIGATLAAALLFLPALAQWLEDRGWVHGGDAGGNGVATVPPESERKPASRPT